MFPHQLCTGKVNPFLSALVYAVFRNESLVFYGSVNCLVITFLDGKHLQTIAFDEEERSELVRAVSLFHDDGRIAIGCGSTIYLLNPSESMLKWVVSKSIKFSSTVMSIHWWDRTTLLIGGNTISIWKESKHSWTKKMENKLSSHIFLSALSPDKSSVVIVHKVSMIEWPKYGFFLRIGGSNSIARRKFCYLSHPRAVLNAFWKQADKQYRIHVLCTTCADGIFRMWAPINPSQPHTYYLSCTIDSSQFTNSPSIPITTAIAGDSDRTQKATYPQTATFHWIDSGCIHQLTVLEKNRLEKSIAPSTTDGDNEDQTIKDTNSIHEIHMQMLDGILQSKPDLIFQVQNNGSLIFWRVDGLGSLFTPMPSVIMMTRIPNAVKPSEYTTFYGTSCVTVNPLSLTLQGSHYPLKFSMIVQNYDREIDHFTIGLSELLFADQRSNELKSRTTWTGHCGATSMLLPSINDSDNIMASLSENGEIGLWRFEYLLDSTQFFRQVEMISSEKSIQEIKWLTSDLMVLRFIDMIQIYQMTGEGLNTGTFFTIEPTSLAKEIDVVYTLHANDDIKTYYLLGLNSAESHVQVWKVVSSDKNNLKIDYLEACQLPPFLNTNNKALIDIIPSSRCKLSQLSSDLKPAHIISYNSSESSILLWNFSPKEKNNMLNEIYSFNVSCPDVLFIKSSSCLSVLQVVKYEDKWRAIITEAKLHRFQKTMDYILPWDGQKIIDASWTSSTIGEDVLGLATNESITVYGQHRRSLTDEGHRWVSIAKIQPDSTLQFGIRTFSFAADGSIYLALGPHLLCSGRWLSTDEIQIEKRKLSSSAVTKNIYNIVSSTNHLLPNIHPQFLVALARWGEFDIINTIMHHLYEFMSQQDTYSDDAVIYVPPLDFSVFFGVKEKESTEQTLDIFASSTNASQQKPLSSHEISFLTETLTNKSVEGINPHDQIRLIAVLESLQKVERMRSSVDAFGYRFLLFANLGHRMNQLLPMSHRDHHFVDQYMIWAYHSESQDILINECLNLRAATNNYWLDFKLLGLPLWIMQKEALCKEIETIARNQYMQEKDPTDSSLFYLALKKKRLLLALWKSSNFLKDYQVMVKFLSNDFDDPKWQKAAMKNAFVLIGKQRYEYAAAFFLLADRLKDAVNVCLKHIKDIYLALTICRCYEGNNGPETRRVLMEALLPEAISTQNRGMISIILWWLDHHELAIQALSMPLETIFATPINGQTFEVEKQPTTVPLLAIYRQLKKIKTMSARSRSIASTISTTTQIELESLVEIVQQYEKMGSPLLALYILSQWEEWNADNDTNSGNSIGNSERDKQPKMISAIDNGQIDFDDWGWSFNAPSKKSTTSTTNSNSLNLAKPLSKDNKEGLDASTTTNNKDNQKTMLQEYEFELCKKLAQEVITVIDICDKATDIPRALIYSYLDTIKRGVQTLCQRFNINIKGFDMITIQRCIEIDMPQIAISMIFQGILSQDIEAEAVIKALLQKCGTLMRLTFENSITTYEQLPEEGKEIERKQYLSEEDVCKWIKQMLHNNQQFMVVVKANNNEEEDSNGMIKQVVVTLLITYLVELMKRRNLSEIYLLVKHWETLFQQGLKGDLDGLQVQVQSFLNDRCQALEFDLDEANWQLDFELGDDMQLVYDNGKGDEEKKEEDKNKNRYKNVEEFEVYQAIIAYAIPHVQEVITDDLRDFTDGNSMQLSTSLVEPLIIMLHKFQQTLPKEKNQMLSNLLGDKDAEIHQLVYIPSICEIVMT